jgi:glycosyltransferase involved in cell wall biosynthesis
MDYPKASYRIALVTTVGGTLRFFSGLGVGLKEKRIETWAIADADEHYAEVCKGEQFNPCPVPLKRRIDLLADCCAILKLWRTFRRHNICSVHAHTPKAGLTAMVAAWLAGVPIRTYTVHGMPIETSTGLRWVVLWLADAVALLCAQHIYCVSPSVRTQLRRYRLPKSRSARVLGHGTICGVDVNDRFRYSPKLTHSAREQVRSELGIPLSAVVAGFVGRFVCDKGIKELVEAWSLSRLVVPNLSMLMVGELDKDGGPASSLIASVQHHPDWYWTGWDPAVEKLFSAMDFLVLPSYREGFPTVVLEAAALCVPSIVSDATGCVDSVVHGDTGLVVPARDSVALARAIAYYSQEPRVRFTHGRAARHRVSQYFSRDYVQSQLIGEYGRLLDDLYGAHDGLDHMLATVELSVPSHDFPRHAA